VKKPLYFLLLLVTVGFSSAHAQIINTVTEFDGAENGNSDPTAGSVIVASPNLVNAATLSETNFQSYSGSNIAALQDGVLGASGNDPGATAVDTDDTWTLTVDLNTRSSPLGFTLTNITLISGWTSDFVNQNYTLAYSTAAAPTDFISLGSYSAQTTETQGSNFPAVTLQTSLATAAGTIATNVADLQFTFNGEPGPAGSNLGSYREVEAFGAASVPEPTTWAMLLGGAALLFGVRRFRTRTA
jgi:hypothetical protein